MHRLRQHPMHRRMGALAFGVCLLGWSWVLLPLLPRTEAAERAAGLPAEATLSAPLPGRPHHESAKDPARVLQEAPPAAGLTGLQARQREGLQGQWAVNAAGQVQPSAELRKRFDHLLSRLGEQNLLQLRASMQQQVTLEAGPEAAAQVIAVWDRYLRLQLWPWKTEVELDRPDTWRQALSERSSIRRDLLGPAFAEAFYGDDERELLSWIEARAPSASSVATQAMPTMPTDAASREAALSEEWQRWERRLEASRRTLEQVQQAPDLSPEQRRIAVQRHFSAAYEGSERQRAEALLSAGAK